MLHHPAEDRAARVRGVPWTANGKSAPFPFPLGANSRWERAQSTVRITSLAPRRRLLRWPMLTRVARFPRPPADHFAPGSVPPGRPVPPPAPPGFAPSACHGRRRREARFVPVPYKGTLIGNARRALLASVGRHMAAGFLARHPWLEAPVFGAFPWTIWRPGWYPLGAGFRAPE